MTQAKRDIRMPASWREQLEPEFRQDYMQQLRAFLAEEKRQGKLVFPPGNRIFAAFDHTPFDKVKVVIVGQDPYHGPGQAHGLCFSVPRGVPVPPSLVNIYKELASDLGIAMPAHGCLESWANQGVLLINSVLTVEAGRAGSHQGKGWERFTDKVIERLNQEREYVVFLLWGAYAQRKGALIDRQRHCVLQAPHPSPLSAHRGFLGCRHFSAANRYLQQHHILPIDWSLPA